MDYLINSTHTIWCKSIEFYLAWWEYAIMSNTWNLFVFIETYSITTHHSCFKMLFALHYQDIINITSQMQISKLLSFLLSLDIIKASVHWVITIVSTKTVFLRLYCSSIVWNVDMFNDLFLHYNVNLRNQLYHNPLNNLDVHLGWVNGSVPCKSIFSLKNSCLSTMPDDKNLNDNIDCNEDSLFSNHHSNIYFNVFCQCLIQLINQSRIILCNIFVIFNFFAIWLFLLWKLLHFHFMYTKYMSLQNILWWLHLIVLFCMDSVLFGMFHFSCMLPLQTSNIIITILNCVDEGIQLLETSMKTLNPLNILRN